MPREWRGREQKGAFYGLVQGWPCSQLRSRHETQRAINESKKRPFDSAVFLTSLLCEEGIMPVEFCCIHRHLQTYFLNSPGMKKEESAKVQNRLVIFLIQ